MQLDFLLDQLTQRKGSDLFITAGSAPLIKVGGALQALADAPLGIDEVARLVHESMNQEQVAEFEQQQEANFAIVNETGGRFRVSAFYQRGNPGMVIRRIETTIPDLDELQLPPIIHDLAMTKRGLIMFVGGTGTGKSTSLAAMLGKRNSTAPGHILTIEDPVEFVHPHRQCIVTQREVGVDTQSFDAALKNALRQAPDVILIGEVRSREIMDYAVSFAETGHLVLATLHANNANQALDRIINFFPSERREQLLMDLSLNLKAVVAQQLIPSSSGHGRVAALEVLLATPLVKEKIRSGDIHELKEIMSSSEEQGMQTFDRHLFRLYRDGFISYENALAHADSANEVRLMAKLEGLETGGVGPEGSESDDDRPRGGSGLSLADY
ncbi:twitching motility protein PilT [Halorhodospira halochloris]|uniref:Twitching motility protein PilT n=1 Tax=Halorhodospira halochloris TaxID=1052 RepID=A0A0X8XAU3_HALHR|nr:PilT/PilU family type 4a pilus ATPase [Halorhodospira halochloris]MBK1652610.1 type IV pili twitching motility protein PilT [Halorhodospira halochloris]BAU58202.1 twitching motility protein PilT [Halorhodospira halochloris]